MIDPDQNETEYVLWRGPAIVEQGRLAALLDAIPPRFHWMVEGLFLGGMATLFFITQGPAESVAIIAIGLLGLVLGSVFKQVFPPKPPVPPTTFVPVKLTRAALTVRGLGDEIPISQIHGVKRDYHMGSPSLELNLPQKTITLISAERDALYAALLSLLPNLAKREITP